MELLQLRYFLVAAQYQHMTKAAEHLQIAQPALSQAIHRLEAELGVPLFERKNRSIELNDEGKFLQKRLIPILSSLDRLPEELRKGKLKKLLFCGTGALLSPTSTQQGLPIPGVCHAVAISGAREAE